MTSAIGRPPRPHLRDDFIAAAQRLIAAKGYEPMSIEDVLREVGVSKGAFYHYFASKGALLEAVIDTLGEASLAGLTAIVEAADLTPVEKLQRYFSDTMALKTARRDVFLELLRVWQSDENAVVREKLRRKNVGRVTPLLARILREGRDTGDFSAADPDDAAMVTVSLVLAMADVLGERIVAHVPGNEADAERVIDVVGAYSRALERVLGSRPETLTIVDEVMLRAWLE